MKLPDTAGLLLAIASVGCASTADATFRRDSGGPLLPEQAAFDVLHYDLDVTVMPETRSIWGVVTLRAAVLEPLSALVLDLDPALKVERVDERGLSRGYSHAAGRLVIDLEETRYPGDELILRVAYGGTPREAPKPPWEGGFTWARTQSGAHWIATSNQGEGADLWWPCKDHPSDEPDSMDIHVTVPRPLVCATNGRLTGTRDNHNGTRTYDWHVSTPINNYVVALNIAPYAEITRSYESVTGEVFPVTYWVLPENYEQGLGLMIQIIEHLRFFEELFGPYPFRADKYGVVETPHLGMEHQTIIAYGNQYRDNKWGYDWLHHHELSHEWWANMVTAPDWNDFWVHEGIGTYTQNLYTEQLHGEQAYHQSMADNRGRILNRRAVAPREPRSSGQMYFIDLDVPDGERQSDSDIYFKASWALHTLRYLIGEDAFFSTLRRMAYPDPRSEERTDGSACRFATTDEFIEIAERNSGRELGWFFEVYFRQPHLPRLVQTRDDSGLRLSWEVPGDLPFPMPVEVRINGELERVAMPEGTAHLSLPADATVELDPEDWILR